MDWDKHIERLLYGVLFAGLFVMAVLILVLFVAAPSVMFLFLLFVVFSYIAGSFVLKRWG